MTMPTVLVVDDCGDTTDAIAALLEHDGFAVSVAAGGSEALAQLRAGLRPCMILVDVRMRVALEPRAALLGAAHFVMTSKD